MNRRLDDPFIVGLLFGLDRVGQPAMVVSSDGYVLHANVTCESVGLAALTVKSRRRKLTTCDDTANAALAMALRGNRPEPARRLEVVVVRSGDNPVAALKLVRLGVASSLANVSEQILVLIQFLEPSAAAPKQWLAEIIYGLSPAEARLSIAITKGQTVKEAAADIGIRTPTARNQLAAAMDKVGVRRQPELVAALSRLGPLTDET